MNRLESATMDRSLHYARLLGALAIGGTVAFLPRMTSNLPESGIVGSLRLGIECLALPGALIGLIAYHNVHAMSIWIVEATNVILYSGLFYFLLATWAKHETKA
jgi:hypothetical protein